MSGYHQTETSKAILTNEEALDLSRRLRRALSHHLCFEQALYEVATPADIESLETLIALANYLYSNPTSDEERKTRKYLQDSIRPDPVFT